MILLKDKLNLICDLFCEIECLANFLCGEGRLETFLEQTPPIDANISKARNGLIETRKFLILAANEKDKQV
jgi:hypothetical protein